MSRSSLSSPTLALVLLFALLSLIGAARAQSIFTAANGCPTVLAAVKPGQIAHGPRAAPVAGVDYEY
ncbi:hypothetical protein JCM11251_006246 [Rhodosporidiobolus azoricus]